VSRPRKSSEGSLSSGKRFGAGLSRHKRPTLAADFPDGTQTAGAPEPKVAVTLFRGVAGLVIVGIVLLISGWLLIGLTVLPTLRVQGVPWLVKWSAWPEGAVPAGAVVMTDPDGRKIDLTSRAGLLFSDGSGRAIMQVVGGPGGDIATGAGNRVILNGVLQDWRYPTPLPSTRLGDNYLAVCLSGDSCQRGDVVLLPIQNVLGEVLGYVHLSTSLGPLPILSDDERPVFSDVVDSVPEPPTSSGGSPEPVPDQAASPSTSASGGALSAP
jgi:hypothetical protein